MQAPSCPARGSETVGHVEAVPLSDELLNAIDVAVGGASLRERLRPPISLKTTLEVLSAMEVALLTIVGTP